MSDLEQALRYAQEALAPTPDDHSNRAGRLNNLSVSLKSRYGRTGSMDDLERALSCRKEALTATPGDHPDQAIRLNNPRNRFRVRYRLKGNVEDNERSVRLFEDGANCSVSLALYRIIKGR